jgi:hypothetical protein
MLEPGLYVVKCQGMPVLLAKIDSPDFPVDHYAIMDVGNQLGLEDVDSFRPVVVHQTPPRITVESVDERTQWIVVQTITDVAAAKARLIAAQQDSTYRVVDNNCEQFVWFIATGEKKSPQISGYATAAVFAGAVTLVVMATAKLLSRRQG